MFFVLILSIIASLTLSFFCSLAEASLYSVPLPYIKNLADNGSKRAKVLLILKEDIGKPIAAILALNTMAATMGAAVCGACVESLWGTQALVFFSVIYTIVLLILSEIVPKQIGVTYSRTTSLLVALPLAFAVKAMLPLIKVSNALTKVINRGRHVGHHVSAEEVATLAQMGTERGVLDHIEGSVIKNVIGLDKILARDILTPRVVVFRLSEETRIAELEEGVANWNYSRIPIFSEKNSDSVVEYVMQRDVLQHLLKGEKELTLKDIARPLPTVPDLLTADRILLELFAKGTHLLSVVGEHGGFVGLVTLEDIIETVLGREIVDEFDVVSDLRKHAEKLLSKHQGNKH